jgi:hypothetical protein
VTRPSLQSEDSLASTVVDSIADTEQDDVDMEDGLEETQTDDMPLRASPEPLDEQAVADDDAEPLEVSDLSPLNHIKAFAERNSCISARSGRIRIPRRRRYSDASLLRHDN